MHQKYFPFYLFFACTKPNVYTNNTVRSQRNIEFFTPIVMEIGSFCAPLWFVNSQPPYDDKNNKQTDLFDKDYSRFILYLHLKPLPSSSIYGKKLTFEYTRPR